jgi:lipopolysaccharide biosynthesis glycosyltransferase
MTIPVFVGYDPREAVAYHVFCHSVLTRTKAKVSFSPVCGEMGDASNTFSKARFLVPEMMGYRGWALFADGDMICRTDIEELWALRKPGFDVMVVKHDYRTKHPVKYLGARNEDYPNKNWSSIMLIDCGNPVWRRPEYKEMLKGPVGLLHRFSFLEDDRIGELPDAWNWLVSEYPYNAAAKLVHFTIGIPPFYPSCDYSAEWFNEMRAMNYHEHWDSTELSSSR